MSGCGSTSSTTGSAAPASPAQRISSQGAGRPPSVAKAPTSGARLLPGPEPALHHHLNKSTYLHSPWVCGWMAPAPPSTVTIWPSARRVAASPEATTAGMPYSRATREAWAARVPPSVTTAAARANSVVQAGAVARATRTSPGWKRLKSPGPWTMRTRRWPRPAGATPAASPYSRLASPSACCSARRLIAASQLRRIAPLAGRISRQ